MGNEQNRPDQGDKQNQKPQPGQDRPGQDKPGQGGEKQGGGHGQSDQNRDR